MQITITTTMQRAVLSYLVLLTTLAALCTVSYAHSTPDAMVIVHRGSEEEEEGAEDQE